MRQPYLIYKRSVRGKKSYYVKIWDEDKYDYSVRKSILSIKDELGTKGNRFPHTSKAGAEVLVQTWLKNRPTKENSKRLDNYLSSFWEPSSDFLKSQEMRGKTYSLTYLKNNKSGIDNFFLPYLEEINKREVLLHQVNASPRKTSECFNSLIKKNPYQNDFIFWGTTPENPLSKDVVAKVFRDIVENKMKIKDRGERGLTFHAWRHWYNSMLRGNVPDHALRQLTGHSSEAMTERYTEITEEQRRAVFELADKIM